MKRPYNPHAVALVLALTLLIVTATIGIAALVNVLESGRQRTLGENTTQVLIAVLGGIIGVLGSYIGQHVRPYDRDRDDQNGNGHP